MANQLSLTIGQNTIPIPLKLTAVQIRAVLRRYCLQTGISIEGRTEVEIVEDVLRSLKKVIADGSLDRHRAELIQAQRDTIESTVSLENDI